MRLYLKEAREKLGLLQKDVAQKLNISPNYYSCIENGERQNDMKTSVLIELSSVLKIPISDMLELERQYQKTIT